MVLLVIRSFFGAVVEFSGGSACDGCRAARGTGESKSRPKEREGTRCGGIEGSRFGTIRNACDFEMHRGSAEVWKAASSAVFGMALYRKPGSTA